VKRAVKKAIYMFRGKAAVSQQRFKARIGFTKT